MFTLNYLGQWSISAQNPRMELNNFNPALYSNVNKLSTKNKKASSTRRADLFDIVSLIIPESPAKMQHCSLLPHQLNNYVARGRAGI